MHLNNLISKFFYASVDRVYRLFKEFGIAWGRRGLVVYALDCGEGGRRFESRSFSFVCLNFARIDRA